MSSLRLLARNGTGLAVNISSIAATLAVGSNIMYCASKAAVDALTRSLALALAPKVRVGPLETNMTAVTGVIIPVDASRSLN